MSQLEQNNQYLIANDDPEAANTIYVFISNSQSLIFDANCVLYGNRSAGRAVLRRIFTPVRERAKVNIFAVSCGMSYAEVGKRGLILPVRYGPVPLLLISPCRFIDLVLVRAGIAEWDAHPCVLYARWRNEHKTTLLATA